MISFWGLLIQISLVGFIRKNAISRIIGQGLGANRHRAAAGRLTA